MKISAENHVFSMSAQNKAAASCEPGEKVIFETLDCFSDQIQSEEVLFENTDWEAINPATGPLKIKGAEIGDTLKVKIEKIELNEQGVMVTAPEMGFLEEFVTRSETKIIPIENNKALFNDKIKIELNPMIGVIGTSPAANEEAVACGIPAAHGGNMDTKVIEEGTVLYLPVNLPGAMLALGDLHAAMGDGEVSVSGIEIAGEVTVKVDLIKNKDLSDPILENENTFYTIASGVDLDAAAKKAANNMFRFLQERLPLSNNEIIMLMSAGCNLEISQVVNPQKTARMRVDKELLSEYDLEY